MKEDFQEKQPDNKFKFKCVKGCDYCCKLNDIALYPFDIMELCNHLELSTKEFHAKHTRFVFDSESGILRCYLITTPNCVFFKDAKHGCRVYESRPVRCRIFPVGRIFNADESVQHYLPKEKCIGFDSGKKQTVQEWVENSGVLEKDELIKEWNGFLNEIKNDKRLPLNDKLFIMFFKKIFYDFDNELAKVIKETNLKVEPDDFDGRMDKLYRMAGLYLYNFDKWKEGYSEFVKGLK